MNFVQVSWVYVDTWCSTTIFCSFTNLWLWQLHFHFKTPTVPCQQSSFMQEFSGKRRHWNHQHSLLRLCVVRVDLDQLDLPVLLVDRDRWPGLWQSGACWDEQPSCTKNKFKATVLTIYHPKVTIWYPRCDPSNVSVYAPRRWIALQQRLRSRSFLQLAAGGGWSWHHDHDSHRPTPTWAWQSGLEAPATCGNDDYQRADFIKFQVLTLFKL